MKFADRVRLCAPPSGKFRNVSSAVHPHEIADSVRLCALPLRESPGTSRALCNPVMKFADSVRLRALPLHESGGTLCAPHDEIVTNLT